MKKMFLSSFFWFVIIQMFFCFMMMSYKDHMTKGHDLIYFGFLFFFYDYNCLFLSFLIMMYGYVNSNQCDDDDDDEGLQYVV